MEDRFRSRVFGLFQRDDKSKSKERTQAEIIESGKAFLEEGKDSQFMILRFSTQPVPGVEGAFGLAVVASMLGGGVPVPNELADSPDVEKIAPIIGKAVYSLLAAASLLIETKKTMDEHPELKEVVTRMTNFHAEVSGLFSPPKLSDFFKDN